MNTSHQHLVFISIQPFSNHHTDIYGLFHITNYSFCSYIPELPNENETFEDTAYYSFPSLQKADTFLSYLKIIYLFRNNLSHNPSFDLNIFVKAIQEYPELIFSDICMRQIHIQDSPYNSFKTTHE